MNRMKTRIGLCLFVTLSFVSLSLSSVNACECTFGLIHNALYNMEDGQTLDFAGADGPIIYNNHHIEELRKIGPLKTEPSRYENVKMFSCETPLGFARRQHSSKTVDTLEAPSQLDQALTKHAMETLIRAIDENEFCEPCRERYFPRDQNAADALKATLEIKRPLASKSNPERFHRVHFYPIAHCVKICGETRQAIPKLQYESLMLMHFEATEFDFWLLCCCASNLSAETARPLYFTRIFGRASDGECAAMKSRDENIKRLSEGTIISRQCVRLFKEKPTTQEIQSFLESTDFGNNNIYPYTDFATVFQCEVQSISLNDAYAELLEPLQTSLSGEAFQQRKAVYNRALVGMTATMTIGSGGR